MPGTAAMEAVGVVTEGEEEGNLRGQQGATGHDRPRHRALADLLGHDESCLGTGRRSKSCRAII